MPAIGADPAFPTHPVTPAAFVEDVIPALFADLDLSPAERAVELRIGIVLRGETGGEWTLHFIDGELGIEARRDSNADFTIVQEVADWRAVLWEGRPAVVADALAARLRPETARHPASSLPPVVAPDPVALAELRRLRGLLEIRVAAAESPTSLAAGGDRSAAGCGDWRLGILFGPGALPTAPDASIELGAAQADEIHRGRLHPLEALMTGELRLEGELGLILQLQAIAMLAASSR